MGREVFRLSRGYYLEETQNSRRKESSSMRADVSDSANAGADEQSKPPAFQIIVLVSKTRTSDS